MINNSFNFSSYSENLLPENKDNIFFITSSSIKKSKHDHSMDELISSIDEMSEFLNPYCDVSMFLAENIHEVILKHPFEKKWSLRLQDEIIAKITPPFQKKFPSYKIGVLSIKKIWEKLSYYLQQLEGKEILLNDDGSIDVDHLIRINLSAHAKTRPYYTLQSYFYSQHLTSKVCELCATLDRKIIERDFLTKKIGTIQKCLLLKNSQSSKTPYDIRSEEEHLISDLTLRILNLENITCQKQLKQKIKEDLHILSAFMRILDSKMLMEYLSLRTQKLFQISLDHSEKNSDRPREVIDEQIAFTMISHPHLCVDEVSHKVYAYFSEMKRILHDLSDTQIEVLSELASLQNDMIAQDSSFFDNSPLYPLLQDELHEKRSPRTILHNACRRYLALYPQLASYQIWLYPKATICLKKLWYSSCHREELTALDKFIIWKSEEGTPDLAPLIPLFSLEEKILSKKE